MMVQRIFQIAGSHNTRTTHTHTHTNALPTAHNAHNFRQHITSHRTTRASSCHATRMRSLALITSHRAREFSSRHTHALTCFDRIRLYVMSFSLFPRLIRVRRGSRAAFFSCWAHAAEEEGCEVTQEEKEEREGEWRRQRWRRFRSLRQGQHGRDVARAAHGDLHWRQDEDLPPLRLQVGRGVAAYGDLPPR